ncbi:epidermal growth factor receptor substrate 15-like 1 [Trichonephila clavata]|uniref:Epidermal growth factor receptor substrate 15-like 1 n=1 Tax=Trichonephila clavata TaxID=2740835 RepID=A0A8X6EWW7_TRICU|nr:epidermal growth factor receptor substrate 15-like 1 [Trichonephila clavata]
MQCDNLSLNFSIDPFQDTSVSSSGDPFGGDPFESVFNVTAAQTTKDDPFLGNDPFGGFPAPSNPDKDPFDPFGLSKSNSIQSPVGGFDADPFGTDPFGASPAAPPRPESPTPALPPKKSKAPPPRPAPPSKAKGPSPKPGPTRAAPAPPVPPPPAVDPFKADFENTSNNAAFPDLFSKTAKTQDAFDPFSNPAAPADNFANFDNFADFDNIK